MQRILDICSKFSGGKIYKIFLKIGFLSPVFVFTIRYTSNAAYYFYRIRFLEYYFIYLNS